MEVAIILWYHDTAWGYSLQKKLQRQKPNCVEAGWFTCISILL